MDISVPVVGFFFVCIVMPQLVKNRAYFILSFATILLVLILDLLTGAMVGSIRFGGGLVRFLYILRGVLMIAELILLVLATGGLSLHQLSDEFKHAFDAVRKGEVDAHKPTAGDTKP